MNPRDAKIVVRRLARRGIPARLFRLGRQLFVLYPVEQSEALIGGYARKRSNRWLQAETTYTDEERAWIRDEEWAPRDNKSPSNTEPGVTG